jgi:hypothetical protein
VTAYSCADCNYEAWTLGAIKEHVYQDHGPTDHQSSVLFCCGECGERFKTSDELDTHQMAHIPSADISCAYCGSWFDATEDAVDHFWGAHPEKSSAFESQLVCPLDDCDANCGTAHSLLNHIENSHAADVKSIPELAEGADNECPICDDRLANREGLFQHAVHTHPELFDQTLRCTLCDTPGVATPDKHIEAHHNPDKQSKGIHSKCPEPECGFSLNQQSPRSPQRQRRSRHYITIEDHYRHEHLSTSALCPHDPCDYRDTASSRVDRHHWLTHETDAAHWDTAVVQKVSSALLESLYAINKQAKKYGRLGDENYRKGKGATAKMNSVKKKALYGVKEAVLQRIYENADTLAIHEIDGNEFWFTDFGTFSFHSPLESLDLPYGQVEYQDTLDNFDPGEEKEHTDNTLKESLLTIESELGINANDHLEQTHVGYGASSYFAGWTYLGE